MVKELFLAIFLGLFLGFALTGSVLGLLKSKKTPTNTRPTPTLAATTSPSLSTSPSPSTEATVNLTVTSPVNDSLVDTKNITLKGQTSAQATIIITLNDSAQTATADQSGNFEIPLTLDTGINLIQVVAVDSNHITSAEQKLTITYSTAKI